jgi:hypothetical protein
MVEKVTRNCKVCYHFRPEEIGGSDFGAKYAETASCSKYYDLDENESEIEGFDRDCERECCELDFWLILNVDSEIKDLYEKYDNVGGNNDIGSWMSFKRYIEKYKSS